MEGAKNEFKKQYAKCRERSGLTYRALEKATGIKHSALVSMQSGNRPCGEESARRIAEAFGLSGDAREAFVLAALNTSQEKVLAAVEWLSLGGIKLPRTAAHGTRDQAWSDRALRV